MFHGYSLNNHALMRHRMEYQSTLIQRMTFVKYFTCVDNRPEKYTATNDHWCCTFTCVILSDSLQCICCDPRMNVHLNGRVLI